MKKFLTLMLALVSLFVLFACNKGDEENEVVNVESVSINKANLSDAFVVGDEVKLSATVLPENATVKGVRWSTSNEAVATVQADGTVKFVGAGEVTITVTTRADASKKDTHTFTVTIPELESLGFEEETRKVPLNDTSVKLEVTATPAGADASVTWTSSDETVAKVDAATGAITPVKQGTVTITATSVAKPAISASIQVEITAPVESAIEEIVVSGTETLYLGYSARLTASVYPLTANQSVVWKSSNTSVVDIDDDGYCTAVGVGVARIQAVSVTDENITSSYHRIEVIEDPDEEEVVDMQGYKIVIMQASSAIGEIDPHHDDYKQLDKNAKIKAWDEAEVKYNCDVAVEPYDDTATWGTPRRDWINNNATSGNVPADIYTISSAWLAGFVAAGSALDVLPYYEKYGKNQMEPSQLECGTIAGKLYIVSTGTSQAKSYADHGLYYNVDKLAALGVKDPAQMFLDGEWTYSGFEAWCKEVQTQLGEGEYAIGGHSYYYWLGMTAAGGVKITDASQLIINIDSIVSKNALSLLNRLVVDGAMNPTADWAEGGGDDGFQKQTTLMTSGRYWFIHATNRWNQGMWAEGEYPNIGYVPYPYPDTMSKEDTRVSTTGGTVYMYAKGRVYGDGFDAEQVYRVVNDIYLNTILYQRTQPTYDAEQVLRDSLATKLSNEASIECAMYYTSKRAFFDPTETIYASTASSIFNAATKEIVYSGSDYQNVMDALKEQYQTDVNNALG